MPIHKTDDGTELFYEWDDGEWDDGEGPGAPVVAFFNGMTQSTEHWKTQVGYLQKQFRVLRWDARGQGGSEVGEPITMDEHIADFVGLLDALEVERAHLVGFSHGARLALGVAAGRPERVERLVLCSATAEPTALARTIVRGWREVLERGDLEAMSWAALPAILGKDYLESHERILEGIVRASVRRNREEGVRALLAAMEEYPSVAEMAGDVEAPTLVLSGAGDPLVEHEGAAKLAELCGGEHRPVDGVGHTIPIEAPERFAEIVREFLG